MHALCLITVKPGKVDSVVEILKKKRKVVKQVMIVTGRADISVILQGSIDQINQMVIDFKKIKNEPSGDSGIVIVDDDIVIDQEKINEERRAYLEEARSQEATD